MMNDFESEFHALTGRLASISSCELPAARLYSLLDELPLTVPPFLRALLVADGTVTMLLEAYFREMIGIRTLAQQTFELRQQVPVLGVGCGDDLFFRKVELSGTESGQLYAFAHTLLNPAVINTRLFAELVTEDVGIGWILRNSARGSFRQVLQINAGGIGQMPNSVNRTYLVSIKGTPALLITEEFPLDAYLLRNGHTLTL
jgi:chorismate-pyruvate lyase